MLARGVDDREGLSGGVGSKSSFGLLIGVGGQLSVTGVLDGVGGVVSVSGSYADVEVLRISRNGGSAVHGFVAVSRRYRLRSSYSFRRVSTGTRQATALAAKDVLPLLIVKSNI